MTIMINRVDFAALAESRRVANMNTQRQLEEVAKIVGAIEAAAQNLNELTDKLLRDYKDER